MLEASNLSYQIRTRKLLDGVSFRANPGELLAIVGANGAGKSTLLKLCTHELTATQGEIHLHNKAIGTYSDKELARFRAVLPQQNSVVFPFLVSELVLMGRYRHHGLFSAYAPDDYARADAALAAVGATHLAARDFTQLSGGEQQLVWLAQLSLHDAALYLLDEPTQQLDVYYRRRVFELIHGWTQRAGKTVLCSTHDVDSLPELSGYLFNLAEETPTLRPISAASVREARAVLEAPPRPAA